MSDKLLISPAQCRAARAMLGWSQEELSKKANVARATIADFEREVRTPVVNNLLAIQKALEMGGIQFISQNGGGIGVRFRSS
jgi:transcriptional regulator with XRE-family HTH domain